MSKTIKSEQQRADHQRQRCHPRPELLDPLTHALKDDLNIVVTSAVTTSKHTWQKGTLPDVFRVSLALAGDVADWPFDRIPFGARSSAELFSGAAYTPVPTTVTLVNRLLGWDVKVSPVNDTSEHRPVPGGFVPIAEHRVRPVS